MSTTRQTEVDRLLDVLGNADAWNTIDDLVVVCDEASYWTDAFKATAALNAKKAYLRRLIKQERWRRVSAVRVSRDHGRERQRRSSLQARDAVRRGRLPAGGALSCGPIGSPPDDGARLRQALQATIQPADSNIVFRLTRPSPRPTPERL